jgi:hypothetical protein
MTLAGGSSADRSGRFPAFVVNTERTTEPEPPVPTSPFGKSHIPQNRGPRQHGLDSRLRGNDRCFDGDPIPHAPSTLSQGSVKVAGDRYLLWP